MTLKSMQVACENEGCEVVADESEDVICADCGEHSCTERCEKCGYDYGTSCCGAGSRF